MRWVGPQQTTKWLSDLEKAAFDYASRAAFPRYCIMYKLLITEICTDTCTSHYVGGATDSHSVETSSSGDTQPSMLLLEQGFYSYQYN